MARADILAGRAAVVLTLKDAAFVKGIKRASQTLKSFGSGMAVIGAGVSAVGTALLGPLAAAVHKFADVGSELNDASARMGIAAGALAEIGYAAEQSGASMEAVETSIKRMQKLLGAAADGSKEAISTLRDLGLTFTELNNLRPEDQFQRIGERLAAMPADFKRTSAALAVFGKQGTVLLPMLDTLAEMRQEARDLGLAPSDDAVKMADDLGDAFHRLKRAAGAVVFEVGAALGEAVLSGTKTITGIVVAVGRWVKQNQKLVTTVAAVGAGLVVAGGAITALGLSAYVAGVALGGIVSVLSALGAVVGVLASPLAVTIGLLSACAIAWARFTESGQQAVKGISSVLGDLKGTALESITGIFDALAAGNLELAGQIAMAGLKLGLLQGVSALSEAVGGSLGDFLGMVGTQLASGDLASAWGTTLSGLQNLWAGFTEGITALFTQAMRLVTDAWEGTTGKISDWILESAGKGGVLGAIGLSGTGIDMVAEKEKAKKQQREQVKQLQRQLIDAEADLAAANAANGQATIDGVEVTAEDAMARVDDLRKALEAAGEPVDAIAKAKQDARGILGGQADAFRRRMDELDRAAQQRSQAAGENVRNRTAGGSAVANNAAVNAAAELKRLSENAEKARAAVANNAQQKKDKLADDLQGAGGTNLSRDVVGSFSAAALSATGAGMGNGLERAARDLSEAGKLLRAAAYEQRKKDARQEWDDRHNFGD